MKATVRGWCAAIGAVFAGVAFAVPGDGGASAATIANADTRAYTVSIIADSRKRDFTMEPGARLEKVCIKGCLIRIDNDVAREFVLEGSERVSIEDGLVYYDGEVASDGGTGRPRAK